MPVTSVLLILAVGASLLACVMTGLVLLRLHRGLGGLTRLSAPWGASTRPFGPWRRRCVKRAGSAARNCARSWADTSRPWKRG
ncbi:MAG: hypothetical protein JWQ46_1967 [Phenylobacterium sp.]|nr:hypothetical protein [Phenylobacterium sp.]